MRSKYVPILALCVFSATACSSSDGADRAASTTSTVAPTTTKARTGMQQAADCESNEALVDLDRDAWGTCQVTSVVVNQQLALANATAAGLPAGVTTCGFPRTFEVKSSPTIDCRVLNFDGSEGTWHFALNPDMSTSQPTYEETKARSLTRADCTATPPDGQFQKDSSSWTGQCLQFWAYIFQFDANTGPCSFLADYGSAAYRYGYKFSDAIIRIDGADHCDLLNPVVEGDMVEVWAVPTGVESYETKMGGTNTYTVFQLVDITVYRHS